MGTVAIILNDWLGYPPSRVKVVGRTRLDVGAGRILANIGTFSAGIPFFVILVLNDTHSPEQEPSAGASEDESAKERWRTLAKQFPFVRDVQFRPNVDFDIGAYQHGLEQLRRESFDGDVLFMNSSLRGPSSNGWLAKYHGLLHERQGIGLCGITLNATRIRDGLPELPHVQSFFLYTSMRVLQEVFPHGLYEGAFSSKKDAIVRGEIAISQAVLRHGYAIRCAAFPEFIYRPGDAWNIPMVFGWRRRPELARKYANIIL